MSGKDKDPCLSVTVEALPSGSRIPFVIDYEVNYENIKHTRSLLLWKNNSFTCQKICQETSSDREALIHSSSTNSACSFSGRNGNLGLVLPCSRSAAWSSCFCRLYYTTHYSWISTSVYFDSLNQMSWLHLQYEAVWRKAIQQAFAACFAGTSVDHSTKCHAILAAVAHNQQQHITAFPHESKLYFCSRSLRSDTISCVIISSSDTTLNLTPMLSSVISHAKEKQKGRSTHNVLSSPLYSFRLNRGILGRQCALFSIFFQERGSWNRAEPAFSSQLLHTTALEA